MMAGILPGKDERQTAEKGLQDNESGYTKQRWRWLQRR